MHLQSGIEKRWASCTKNNELLFNWRSVMAPSNILDYIIVHELCHMKYKNHSKEFWDSVCEILPDYEIRREWLKNNGIKLDYKRSNLKTLWYLK